MAEYELTFELDPLGEDQEDAICDRLDAVVATHGSTTLVTLTGRGCSVLDAAKRAVRELEHCGGVVHRLYEDLVSRSMIAQRARTTPQAVGQWVRGERQVRGAGDPVFPEPYNYVAGGVWLWGEVNAWLVALDRHDGMNHPHRIDYALLNEWLSTRRSAAAVRGWTGVATLEKQVRVQPATVTRAPGAARWLEPSQLLHQAS